MAFLVQPLLEEYDDEHGRHDEAEARRIKRQHAADQTADQGTEYPVAFIEPRDPEHEPAAVDALRQMALRGEQYGERLIAEPVNEEEPFPPQPPVRIEQRQPIEEMAGLDQQRQQERCERCKRRHEHRDGDEFERAAEDDERHEERIVEREAHDIHVDAVGKAQKGKACEYGYRIRKSRPQSLQAVVFLSHPITKSAKHQISSGTICSSFMNRDSFFMPSIISR